MEYETLLEIITARDVRRAHAFRQQTLEEGADFDELFTGIDNTARKRDFGGTLVGGRAVQHVCAPALTPTLTLPMVAW